MITFCTLFSGSSGNAVYFATDRGALLVEKIHGDFFNVMGLPVLRLSRKLLPLGVHCLD